MLTERLLNQLQTRRVFKTIFVTLKNAAFLAKRSASMEEVARLHCYKTIGTKTLSWWKRLLLYRQIVQVTSLRRTQRFARRCFAAWVICRQESAREDLHERMALSYHKRTLLRGGGRDFFDTLRRVLEVKKYCQKREAIKAETLIARTFEAWAIVTEQKKAVRQKGLLCGEKVRRIKLKRALKKLGQFRGLGKSLRFLCAVVEKSWARTAFGRWGQWNEGKLVKDLGAFRTLLFGKLKKVLREWQKIAAVKALVGQFSPSSHLHQRVAHLAHKLCHTCSCLSLTITTITTSVWL